MIEWTKRLFQTATIAADALVLSMTPIIQSTVVWCTICSRPGVLPRSTSTTESKNSTYFDRKKMYWIQMRRPVCAS